MLILPFIHKVYNKNLIKIHTIHILTVGGKQLWEESDNVDIQDILMSNDIYLKHDNIIKHNNIVLCNIDSVKTKIEDFYMWEETSLHDVDIFCWRKFIYLEGMNKENWLEIPKSEKLGIHSLNKIIGKIIEIN
jgi:hypothetical protein